MSNRTYSLLGWYLGVGLLVFSSQSDAWAWSNDIELSTSLTNWVGLDMDDQVGFVQTCGGDTNGDGTRDVALAVPNHDEAMNDNGAVWVFNGPVFAGSQHMDSTSATMSIFGDMDDQLAGWRCDCDGDLDADGYNDIVLSTPVFSDGIDETGKVYVVFGRASGWAGAMSTAAADASFLGENDGDQAGYSIETAGDFNGDGAHDLAVGAPFNAANGWHSGKVYVFYGRDQSEFHHISLHDADSSFFGHESNKSAGGALSVAGDANGDGLADLLIGNANEGGTLENWTYLEFGSESNWGLEFDLVAADASYVGEALGDDAGNTLAPAGDTNGDGLDDFLIGAPYNNEVNGVAGQVYLIFGRTSGWSPGTSLAYADASFLGENGGDVLGWSLSGAGDVNGDGLGDFVLGAPGNGEYQPEAGQTYLFFGKTTGWAMDTSAGDADASFIGEAIDDQAGWSVSGGGDLDGDGFDDLLIGAPYSDDGANNAGQVYVVYGTSCTDSDTDGYGAPGDPACPNGGALDCDDFDAAIHPSATETCDGVDEDCDGVIPSDELDDDADGFRVCEGDCDDTNGAIFPGAAESCDGVDNDCDGSQPIWDQDLDSDGTSSCAGNCDDSDASIYVEDLDDDGFSPCDGDCDDADAAFSPDATELCDGLDNDCDEVLPDDEQDADADGFMGCEGDCDDSDNDAFPEAPEMCDGADNDCNGVVDDLDSDEDGHIAAECGGADCDDSDPSVNADILESCDDAIDNDCDGLVDSEDDDCATGDDDTTTEGGDDDTNADDDTTDQPEKSSGCECAQGYRAAPSPPSGTVLCLLLCGSLAFLWRRRSRFVRRRVHCAQTRFISLLISSLILTATGCPDSGTGDDDDTTTTDDDDELEPGGQIDGPATVDFGVVYLGDSVERTLEIRNTGIQPLVISTVLISGPSVDFDADFDEEITVAADEGIYLPLSVTFSPSKAAMQQASLVLISSAFNAGPTEPFTIQLSGNGVEDLDGDGAPVGDDYDEPDADCDDSTADVSPDALEVCNGIDDDCDGTADNVPDDDGDGSTLCDAYPDCDETDSSIHPVWVDPLATGGLGTESQPYGSLSDALVSDHCGQVLLRAGTYYEGEAIEVGLGPVEIVSVDGHLAAVVSGGGLTSLFTVVAGPVTFRDLLFEDGYSASGGAAIHTTSDVEFIGCAFDYNFADAGAGAIEATGGIVTLDDCQFTMNAGTQGGAVASSGDVVISSSTFVGNAATLGGAVYSDGADITLLDSSFLLNTASFGAGVLALVSGVVTVDACEFQSNETPLVGEAGGAGLVVQGAIDLTISSCVFSDNASVLGGAMMLSQSLGSVSGTDFRYNQASSDGGGGTVDSSGISFTDCTFAYNEAGECGGGLYTETLNEIDVSRCLFLGNQAAEGGGLFSHESWVSVSNSIFDANTGSGAAIYHDDDLYDLTIDHCTMFDNHADTGSGALYIERVPSHVTLTNSVLSDNEPYSIACTDPGLSWDYTLVYHPSGDVVAPGCQLEVGTNIQADPAFHNATANLAPLDDDLHLLPTSPAVDTANPDDESCLDPDGSHCDMGAYGGPNSL